MARILLVLNSRCAAARTPHTSTTQDTSGTSGAALRKTPRAPTKTPRRRRPHFFPDHGHASAPPPINTRDHRPNLGTPARGGASKCCANLSSKERPCHLVLARLDAGLFHNVKCCFAYRKTRAFAGALHKITQSHIPIVTDTR